jgi:hypothetical protein
MAGMSNPPLPCSSLPCITTYSLSLGTPCLLSTLQLFPVPILFILTLPLLARTPSGIDFQLLAFTYVAEKESHGLRSTFSWGKPSQLLKFHDLWLCLGGGRDLGLRVSREGVFWSSRNMKGPSSLGLHCWKAYVKIDKYIKHIKMQTSKAFGVIQISGSSLT